jgi:hypothetical protein
MSVAVRVRTGARPNPPSVAAGPDALAPLPYLTMRKTGPKSDSARHACRSQSGQKPLRILHNL